MHQAALEIRGQGNEQRKYQTNVAIPLTAIKAKAGSVIERRIGTFKAPALSPSRTAKSSSVAFPCRRQ